MRDYSDLSFYLLVQVLMKTECALSKRTDHKPLWILCVCMCVCVTVQYAQNCNDRIIMMN